ncbi:hypothetical protein [Arthrobacter sp. MMS18-M83]|uniref:hypothetical protein n=1 Tax=Arthrobacter sp. MMS18-M83 TaxID=2996261 RepID=UPI00227BDEBC|nr:hypothetical protein [Arthrobacter sp. MMS18-M83]WAH96288.1 hypothetical protein OW521_17960 [Arthrobacter sp. MMS18-M83]
MPDDATLELIHKKLERKRGRTITVTELPELAKEKLCGVWLICEDQDIVLHAPTKSDWHRQQIILHEFSHMILEHDLDSQNSALVKSLLPDLDPAQVLRTLARSSYTDDAELAAEALADQLATRIINSDAGAQSEPLAFRKVFG